MAKNYVDQAELLNGGKIKIIEREVEGFANPILFRTLSGYESQLLQKAHAPNGVPDDEYLFILVAKSIVDVNGEQILTVDQAKEMDNIVVGKLVLEALDINQISKKAVDKVREDLKNQSTSTESD